MTCACPRPPAFVPPRPRRLVRTRTPRDRLVAAADRSDASAGPLVERAAHAGIRLCQRTKTDSLWFASSAARAECARASASGCAAVVVGPDVDVDVVVELAWFDPLEQPATTTAQTTRA